MEVLVQSLLDLDVRNSQGRTPLDLAAFKGHVECVDVLINQGASILVKDFTLKRTPIHAAGMDLELVAPVYNVIEKRSILFAGLYLIVVGLCFNLVSHYINKVYDYAHGMFTLCLQLLMVIQNVCGC